MGIAAAIQAATNLPHKLILSARVFDPWRLTFKGLT